MDRGLTFDLYIWKDPRDLDADQAWALLDAWHATGGDPSDSPFEPSTDVGWFYRELMKDAPGFETSTDAVPTQTSTPIWLSSTQEPAARLVAVRLAASTPRDVLEDVFGLAAKYDLVLFDARSDRLTLPLQAMAAYASATFWPAGAIQAAVAGGIGAVIAVVAWILSIPLLSGLLVLIGAFMVVMAVLTFVHEGRRVMKSRRG